MDGSLLLPLVGRVAGKSANALIERVTRICRIDGDRDKLERQLLAVQSLLVDAEAKSETNPAIKRWMEDLRTVAYKADDVLDGFEYEALRRLAQAGKSSFRKVMGYLTVLDSPVLFRLRASRDLSCVLGKINDLVKEMNTFGLVECKEPQQVAYRQTHSALDDSAEIVGRDHAKEVVVGTLLGQHQRDEDKVIRQRDEGNVQVLPIVGMGGVGKTTLAKMVFNDRRVQKHFELKMWHCVSQADLDACPTVKLSHPEIFKFQDVNRKNN